MTRKEFELIAEAIRHGKSKAHNQAIAIENYLLDRLHTTNDKFDDVKFKQACRLNKD